jgi:hypothetical protein
LAIALGLVVMLAVMSVVGWWVYVEHPAEMARHEEQPRRAAAAKAQQEEQDRQAAAAKAQQEEQDRQAAAAKAQQEEQARQAAVNYNEPCIGLPSRLVSAI